MSLSKLQKHENSIARAKQAGYAYGEHIDNDSQEIVFNYNKKTQDKHESILQVYISWSYNKQIETTSAKSARDLFSTRSRECVESEVLCNGAFLPPLEELKDFFRFYIAQSRGHIAKNGRATLDTCLSNAEALFAGFTRRTGTVISENEREPICEFLFKQEDLDRVMKGLWNKSDPFYIHERNRVQVSFISPTFCWTGARMGAFFTEGLRWKDIELVLKRFSNGEIKPIHKIDQRWVKNNRDPENVVYSIACEEDRRLRYNETQSLLALAFADGALFGYENYADLQQQQIPSDCSFIQLRWKDEVLERPILRHVEKDVVTCEPMKRGTFEHIWNGALTNTGYSCRGGMHMVRRSLAKSLDERYKEAVRAQHINHTDTRIYGASYMANTSAANGKFAFLGKAANHEAVDHFQGLEQFREEGMPLHLPSQEQTIISMNPDLQHLVAKLQACVEEHRPDHPMAVELQQKIENHKRRLTRVALKQYQEDWRRAQRDKKVLSRGRLPETHFNADEHILISLLPERKRLAQMIQYDEDLDDPQMRQANDDLKSLCERDYTTVYRPGEEPTIHGECPVCNVSVVSFPPRSRSHHIHSCRHKEEATANCCPKDSIRYCFDCFTWIPLFGQWNKHCDQHLDTFGPRSCDRVTYRHTVVREFRCGGCAGPSTSEKLRLKPYTPQEFWPHLYEHVKMMSSWPSKCFYFDCHEVLGDASALGHHLKDSHYAAGRSLGRQEAGCSEKRKGLGKTEDQAQHSITPYPAGSGWQLSARSCVTAEAMILTQDKTSTSSCASTLTIPDIKSPDWPTDNQSQDFESEAFIASPTELDLAKIDPVLRLKGAQLSSTLNVAYPQRTSHNDLVSTPGPKDDDGSLPHKVDHTAQDDNIEEGHRGEMNECPVEMLVAFNKGWYLTKWQGWEHKNNEWRLGRDLPEKMVDEYHRTHTKNDFGAIVGKARRKDGIYYKMQWRDLAKKAASWLREDEVEDELIWKFEVELEVKRLQPPRKKRRRLAKY